MMMNPIAKWQVHATGDIDYVIKAAQSIYPEHSEYMEHVNFGFHDSEDDTENMTVDVRNLCDLVALLSAIGGRVRISLSVDIEEGEQYQLIYQFHASMALDNYYESSKHKSHVEGRISNDKAMAASQKRIFDAIKVLKGAESDS
jgi:hypothetical protein